MRNVIAVAVLALVGCGSGQAQTRCDGPKCIYEFGYDSADGWPGWSQWTPPGINEVSIADGSGAIEVRAHGGHLYLDNHSHQTWTEAGKGFGMARAEFSFWGDAGRPGWIDKLTDGYHGPEQCHALQSAPRASDDVFILTVFDDGESYVGGLLGGDLQALGVVIPATDQRPPVGYSVLALVEKLPGESMPVVLKYLQGPEIPVEKDDVKLTVKVWQDQGEWRVRATGNKKDWEMPGLTLEAKLRGVPNVDGQVGLDTTVLARPYCIYGPGGQINRRFRVNGVTGWK